MAGAGAEHAASGQRTGGGEGDKTSHTYLAAREHGLRIPRDVSVVGFDGMDFARVLDPPLTTVALDAELLGATAFELLGERMAGGRPRRPIVLPAELVVRGSTAPPR